MKNLPGLAAAALLCGCAAEANKPAAPAPSAAVLYPSTYQVPASAPTLIRNATVLTSAGTRVDHADVLMGAGRIVQVGTGLSTPPEALLDRALTEVRQPKLLQGNDERLLTRAGRATLSGYLNGAGRIVFDFNHAADIRRVVEFAKQEHVHVAIRGAAAGIPVLLDPPVGLPDTFDSVGSTLANSARLQRAGKIAFSFDDPSPHILGKLRQGAGLAVAHGLPFEAALTRNPAEIFGVADRNGSIEPGRMADLALWSGDPLEVTTLPDEVFVQGLRQKMHSRQTELRDRYLTKLRNHSAR